MDSSIPLGPFGKYLRERRMAAGITLRTFASTLEVSPTYLSGVETGLNPVPTLAKLRIISRELDIPLEELVERANRIGDEAQEIVENRPEMVKLLRATRHLSHEEISRLISRIGKP